MFYLHYAWLIYLLTPCNWYSLHAQNVSFLSQNGYWNRKLHVHGSKYAKYVKIWIFGGNSAM